MMKASAVHATTASNAAAKTNSPYISQTNKMSAHYYEDIRETAESTYS